MAKKKGIANLLSVPMLESLGYKILSHTDRNWEVVTPGGETIKFKRDSGMCKGMPYVDLHDHKEGLVMIETVEKNFEGFTKREIEKVILARKVQSRIGHPPNRRLKEIVSLLENG